jgi:hypothetical protein
VLISSLRLFLLREEEQPRDRGRMNGETGSECGVCSGFSRHAAKRFCAVSHGNFELQFKLS